MIKAEYAFGLAARDSVRGAFLNNLSEDSIVLQPTPQPGRAAWETTPESKDKLEWYPTIAAIAGSSDLGFTSGPFKYTVDRNQFLIHGDFVSLWRRDAQCKWQVVFDAGSPHAAADVPPAQLDADRAKYEKIPAPPAGDGWLLQAEKFAELAQDKGMAAALSAAAARNFRLILSNAPPTDGAEQAAEVLKPHSPAGTWQQAGKGASSDRSLGYAYGTVSDDAGQATHAYLQIWEYEKYSSGRALRLLLLNPLPPKK